VFGEIGLTKAPCEEVCWAQTADLFSFHDGSPLRAGTGAVKSVLGALRSKNTNRIALLDRVYRQLLFRRSF
jgi:hypothetical protein